MVGIENRKFMIDGEPRLILAGEVHYFRLKKKDWQDRLTKLKEAGFNAVATYIPWICHEEAEGEFDFNGRTREELDLFGFLELCRANDLYLIARPGPFVMAELKNEGIPHWVARKYPELLSVTWDGREAKNTTLDYLSPNFLDCVSKWYAKVIPILSRYLQPEGGNLIALQLDNEIGMISWCCNAPDLTEHVAADFKRYLAEQYPGTELEQRYFFPWDDEDGFAACIRTPKDEYALELHKDLGLYMRRRTAEYVKILTSYALDYGIKDIPYLINIHGTAGGRGLSYPIGISQLYEAYTMSDDYLSGSDIYLGSLTMDNFQDLYILNTYMEAVNRENQPLASFEFECGDANYGETFGGRTDVSAVDFKTRMCIAQGNKILNCYLFCGGTNYQMSEDHKDGNNRIAFTGERHGFAAPVSPEGELNYTYPRMARVMNLMMANEKKLASMQEERDDVALGFIPDYYMTEFHYPKSGRETAFCEELTRFRGYDGFERMGRSLLLNNFRFSALNIQDKNLDGENTKTLVIFSSSYMAAEIQQKLVEFVRSGKNVILYGLLPVMDMEGKACAILKDFLEVQKTGYVENGPNYFLSAIPRGILEGGAEVSCSYVQTYEIKNADVLMERADTGEICGFVKHSGAGKMLVLGTPFICHIQNIRKIMDEMGSAPALCHNNKDHGIFMTMMKNEDEERYLHIINLDGFEKEAVIFYKGNKLFDGKRIRVGSSEGLMLPLDLEIEGIKIKYATAEIIAHARDKIMFRLTQQEDVICISGKAEVKSSEDYDVEVIEGTTYIKSKKDGRIDNDLECLFNR